MLYLKAEISKPLILISCGYFIADKPWKHMKRNLDSFEIIIGTHGSIFMQQDNNRYEVTPQNSFLLLPGHTHCGYAISPPDTSFYWMHFQCRNNWEIIDKTAASAYISSMKINSCFEGLSENILVPLFMDVNNHEKLTIQFQQMMHSANSSEYTSYTMDYMVTLILMELTQQFIDVALEKISQKSNIRINTIIEWLHVHLDRDISVAQLSNHFGYNKDYFSRYFKKHTGMSVLHYLRAMRISKAKELLCESSLSVKEIAYSLGYKDDKYFMKQFKAAEKITPTKYRNTFYKVHLNNK